MPKGLLLYVLLLFSLKSVAQQSLSRGRHTSIYTYIYRISNAEAVTLSGSALTKVNEKYLHTLVDSFFTDKQPPVLKSGNYLFVYARENSLVYSLHNSGAIQYKLLNNNRDLVVLLHSPQGQPINHAKVFANNREMLFDATTQTFRLDKKRKASLLKVYYEDEVYLFSLQDNRGRYRNGSLWYKISHTFPVKYLAAPFRHSGKYVYKPVFSRGPVAYENNYRGFMVFSKPKYKPNDTVHLKAFVLNRKSKPVNRPLLIRISDRYLDTDSIMGIVKPYRSGGFEYSFVVNDSLDLDERYLITLEEKSSRKYNVHDYTGDLEDDEYAAKRKVLMRGTFEYEEYELSSIQFTARADKKEHQRGNPVAVYLKATDENNLPVTDGRVEITVKPYTAVSMPLFLQANIFLPDTLWQHTQTLEAAGETKVQIPDSIFPNASFPYEVRCVFLNSNNERQSSVLEQKFNGNTWQINFTAEADNLQIYQLRATDTARATATLYSLTKDNDTLQKQQIVLPAIIKIDPFIKKYTVVADSCEGSYVTSELRRTVSCNSLRTHDSIMVQLINPHRIPCWITIFANKKVIYRYYGTSLLYAARTITPANYFVSIQCVYGGNVYNNDYTIPYQDKVLNIQVNQPQYVYPGQTVPVEVTVTDIKGSPVADADVTAFGYTSRFTDAPKLNLPYLGKLYFNRKRYGNFRSTQNELEQKEVTLNWQKWSRQAGLDSIEYFKFLHPRQVYVHAEAVTDSITQIAPFVVIKGELQHIHQLYIDEVPVFFDQAVQLQPYSFQVNEGKHKLRLRTNKQMITLDSMWAAGGMKTFISINSDASNKQVVIEKMPDTLTAYEKNLWARYMLVIKNNFGQSLGMVEQQQRLFPLNNYLKLRYFAQDDFLAGPFTSAHTTFSVFNKYRQQFEPEGNYTFEISPGLIKQKQPLYERTVFSKNLFYRKPDYNLKDLVLTVPMIDSIWQHYLDHRNATEDLFRNEEMNYGSNNSKLFVSVKKDENGRELFVKNILLFRNDDPDYLRVYKGESRNLGFVQPGVYRIMLLLKNDHYIIRDSLQIKPYGVNYFTIDNIVRPGDSISAQIAATINGRERNYYGNQQVTDLSKIKETFNEKYVDANAFTRVVYGQVRGDKDLPLTGISVVVKGTKTGTLTDAQGNFRIRTPEKGTLVFSGVGYNPAERAIGNDNDLTILLSLVTNALNEVVVVGYGYQKMNALTGSVTVVENSGYLAGGTPGLMIRGLSSVNVSTEPLIIVDGIPYQGKLADIDPALIADMSVLKDAAAASIWGARAGNGVVIITTGKAKLAAATSQIETPQAGNVLRRHFRDDAFWQPRLNTDASGKASFTVTFPDDITQWRTQVIAVNNHRQIGSAEGSVSAFKIVSANLAQPQFIVAGDSMYVIGKALNYKPDSIQVLRKFYTNDTLIKEGWLGLRNSYIDTFAVTAGKRDSLKLKYTIEKGAGYFDGEERSIPVFPKGVMETTGIFAALQGDTSFTWQPQNNKETVTIHAETAVLPVLLDEIDKLRDYEYLCNEQLASKLKALLLKKKVYNYLGKAFKEEKNIRDLISKLNQNKADAGLWGWWNNNVPVPWISLHATEALLLAEAAGYTVSINKRMMTDYLVFNTDSYRDVQKISALRLLKLLDAKVDFKRYIDSIEHHRLFSLNDTLRLQELKQQLGMTVQLDSLLAKQSKTALGNSYWGEEGYSLFDNAVQNTLIMYRVLKRAGGHGDILKKIQFYFLEKRKNAQWRNTYESSLILETILPDLMQDEKEHRPAALVINGGAVVQTFPYTTTMQGSDRITIQKTGTLPVYFTAYSRFQNINPQRTGDNFVVAATFEKDGRALSALKAGEPIELKVTVSVKADADYVMVEIPIPAGCSYRDKMQTGVNNEVHREYFKNKVSIFCSALTKGQYTFTVALLPRYTGIYHVNPAKAEMMYFPVIFGREGMKKIRIQ